MAPFWRFIRLSLRDRTRLAWAMGFAFISAAGLGVGLLALLPMMKLILGDDARDLPQLAAEFNARGGWFQIPQWFMVQLPATRFQGVLWIIVGVGVLTVLGAAANYLHQSMSITLATRTIAAVRLRLFERVVRLPLLQVVRRGPSDFVARIIRDTAELQAGLIALTSKAVAELTKGLAAFIVAVIIEWRLTIVAMVVAPLLGLILRKLGKRIRRGTRGALHAQQQLLRVAGETMQGLRAVKASTGESDAAERFERINQQVAREELRARGARALSGPLLECLALIIIGVLAIISAKQIIDGAMRFDRFFLALTALAVAGASFKPLSALMAQIQAAAAPAQRLLEIMDEPVEAHDAQALPDLQPHRQSIEFDDVTLTYSPSARPALDRVRLRLEHGQRVAVVGPNGSGKTTLLSLLPRLLDPDAGQVLIDGVDVRQVNLPSLRRQIGVVTQETMLFHGTIAQNIGFGAGGATREQVIEAARRAHAHQFISALPGGYDADVVEHGASLSGGQRQRLAIARAILRDPRILILDEATSQIDADSESHIHAALVEFSEGRTTIIIAHRLATVVDAERIVVMDHGRIVDQGTHDELLGRCELYRSLTRTQLVA